MAALVPTATAQTATASWSNLNVGNLEAVPSPATLSASDGTTVSFTHSFVTNGGSFEPIFDNSFVVSFDGTFGGAQRPLLFQFDNDSYDPGDRVTGVFELGQSVQNLQFRLTDIDVGNFRDAVEVFYDTGNGIFVNAATNTAFWTANPGIARTNDATVNGWTGIANSGQTSTNGDLIFNFGATSVKRIRITYNSYTGTGNPGQQLMGLSDLQFTSPRANVSGADLSLTKTALSTTASSGSAATFRLTVSSAASSQQTANNVTVRDAIPAGFSFTGATGSGAYDPASGIWTVGSVPPGQSRTIDITGTITASGGATVRNVAEIASSSAPDRNSVPGNNNPAEDDYAAATITVTGGGVAGVAPNLQCPAGRVQHDWDVRNWASGTTNNTYPLGNVGNISFALNNPGVYLNNAAFGGQSPVGSASLTGGLNPPQRSVIKFVDLARRSDVVTTTIALPARMQGAQFRIFDVDSNANQFADQVTVTGRLDGATVIPVLTNGRANFVSGNSAFGNGASNSDSGDGTVVVTFSRPIDTIIIQYGNHDAAPANPGQQAIALHDIDFCLPTTTIAPAKTSVVISDPVSNTTNPKAIPGAIIEYCIRLTNSGISPAANVSAVDPLPANVTYVAGSMVSGTTCANASTVEDDNATGPDESDPVGASFANRAMTAIAPTIAAGASVVFKLRATVN